MYQTQKPFNSSQYFQSMKFIVSLISIILLGVNCPHASAQSVQKKYLHHDETIENPACDETITDSATNDKLIIQNIAYNYQLFSDNGARIDCCGTLDLSISFPQNTSILIFERTRSHLIDPDTSNLKFLIKSEYPVTTNLSIPEIYWGTYFRLCAILYDGTRICSPIYSINDYIEKTDLDELLKASALEEIGLDKISLHIRNKRLHVNTPMPLNLSIFDLYVEVIFNGDIQQSSEIPLDHINTPIIIARYRTQNIIKTTKLQVQ